MTRAVSDDAVEHEDAEASDDEIPSLLERLKEFVGTIQNLPPDASINLDYYLYGAPRKSEDASGGDGG
jgi:hypothetical protein